MTDQIKNGFLDFIFVCLIRFNSLLLETHLITLVPYDQVRTVRSHCDRTVVWSPIDFIRTRSIYDLIGLSAQTSPTRRWFMTNDLRLNTIEAQVRKLEDKPVASRREPRLRSSLTQEGGGDQHQRCDGAITPHRFGLSWSGHHLRQPPLITQESNLLIGGVLQTEQLVTEH